MKRLFPRASKRSRMLGYTLCLIHIFASWSVVIHVATTPPDAQWQLIWIFFWPFDLPCAVAWLAIAHFLPDWYFYALGDPIGDFKSFIMPTFLFGIVGPLLYLIAPQAISSYLVRHPRRKYYEYGDDSGL
jgi:hypothetical protein